MLRRWAWAATLGLAMTSTAATASAHGGGAASIPPASELPPGPIKKDILALQRTLQEEKHSEELLDRPLDEALRAMERKRGAAAAGDDVHAAMLHKLAQRWVATGKAVLSAVQLEKKATAQAERLADLEDKVQRAESLLSEQQARLGRLEAKVKQAEKRAAERRKAGLTAASPKKGAR